ncbi:hypothetical protein CEXT_227371 [Caerostris extrusa]|uniref:Uncharacterized protein n=1 Tax=Caerostris extrusa TaxID=172846 RepID=A0AAV4NSR9_CAEEX|nr:hypothetical protein CEXT_227371 [Caerostris extrusa]
MLLKTLKKSNLCYFAQQVAPNRKQTPNASAFAKYSVLKTALESVPVSEESVAFARILHHCRRNLLRDTNAECHLLLRLRQEKKLRWWPICRSFRLDASFHLPQEKSSGAFDAVSDLFPRICFRRISPDHTSSEKRGLMKMMMHIMWDPPSVSSGTGMHTTSPKRSPKLAEDHTNHVAIAFPP